MRIEMPSSSATCLSGRSSWVTANSTSTSRGGESVIGDEGLALLLDGRRGECFLGSLLMFALLLGLGQAEQAGSNECHAGRHEQHERADHDEGDIARGHERQRDARCGERAHVIGRTAHDGPEGGRVHARCQLSKRGSEERDEKA